MNWGEKSRFSISSSLEGSWERGEVPGTQQDPLCVLNLLGLGTSTSPTRWGDHRAGEVAPPDLSWGHLFSGEKSMSHRWKRKGSGGGGAVKRPGPVTHGGASAEGLCENAHRSSGKRIERKRRVAGGRCYMAVVITFSSGSTVFS